MHHFIQDGLTRRSSLYMIWKTRHWMLSHWLGSDSRRCRHTSSSLASVQCSQVRVHSPHHTTSHHITPHHTTSHTHHSRGVRSQNSLVSCSPRCDWLAQEPSELFTENSPRSVQWGVTSTRLVMCGGSGERGPSVNTHRPVVTEVTFCWHCECWTDFTRKPSQVNDALLV